MHGASARMHQGHACRAATRYRAELLPAHQNNMHTARGGALDDREHASGACMPRGGALDERELFPAHQNDKRDE
jgi:hypothetical protein